MPEEEDKLLKCKELESADTLTYEGVSVSLLVDGQFADLYDIKEKHYKKRKNVITCFVDVEAMQTVQVAVAKVQDCKVACEVLVHIDQVYVDAFEMDSTLRKFILEGHWDGTSCRSFRFHKLRTHADPSNTLSDADVDSIGGILVEVYKAEDNPEGNEDEDDRECDEDTTVVGDDDSEEDEPLSFFESVPPDFNLAQDLSISLGPEIQSPTRIAVGEHTTKGPDVITEQPWIAFFFDYATRACHEANRKSPTPVKVDRRSSTRSQHRLQDGESSKWQPPRNSPISFYEPLKKKMGKRRRSSPPDDPDLEHQDKRSRHVSRSELDDMEEDLIMSPHIRFQSCSLRESSMNSSIMFDWLMQDADINTRSGTGLSDEHWQRRSLSYASAADPAVDQTEEDELLPSEHASQPTDTFEPNTEVTGNPGSDDGRNTSQTEDLGQAARAPRPSSPEQPPQPRPIRPRQFPPIGSQFYRQSFRGNNDRRKATQSSRSQRSAPSPTVKIETDTDLAPALDEDHKPQIKPDVFDSELERHVNDLTMKSRQEQIKIETKKEKIDYAEKRVSKNREKLERMQSSFENGDADEPDTITLGDKIITLKGKILLEEEQVMDDKNSVRKAEESLKRLHDRLGRFKKAEEINKLKQAEVIDLTGDT